MNKFYLFLICIFITQNISFAFDAYTSVSPSGVGTMYLQKENTPYSPRDSKDSRLPSTDDNIYYSPRGNIYYENDGIMHSQSGSTYFKSGQVLERY